MQSDVISSVNCNTLLCPWKATTALKNRYANVKNAEYQITSAFTVAALNISIVSQATHTQLASASNSDSGVHNLTSEAHWKHEHSYDTVMELCAIFHVSFL